MARHNVFSLARLALLVIVIVGVCLGRAHASEPDSKLRSKSNSSNNNNSQQHQLGAKSKPKHKPVKIELYYMPQCPGCRQMISNSFRDAFDTPGFSDMADVTFVPYGRTKETKTTHQYNHVLETCALHYLATSTETSSNQNYHHQDLQFRYIDCIDHSRSPHAVEVDLECAKVAGLSETTIERIEECGSSGEGQELARRAVRQADSHPTKLHYFPWVVVNNEHTDEMHQKVWESLFEYVCGIYTGPKRSAHCWEIPDHEVFAEQL